MIGNLPISDNPNQEWFPIPNARPDWVSSDGVALVSIAHPNIAKGYYAKEVIALPDGMIKIGCQTKTIHEWESRGRAIKRQYLREEEYPGQYDQLEKELLVKIAYARAQMSVKEYFL